MAKDRASVPVVFRGSRLDSVAVEAHSSLCGDAGSESCFMTALLPGSSTSVGLGPS